MFTLALERVFKKPDWSNQGIMIKRKRLNNFRFANNIVIAAGNSENMKEMILELNKKAKQKGLDMNINKTKVKRTSAGKCRQLVALKKTNKMKEIK